MAIGMHAPTVHTQVPIHSLSRLLIFSASVTGEVQRRSQVA